jgi:hypothetical protein
MRCVKLVVALKSRVTFSSLREKKRRNKAVKSFVGKLMEQKSERFKRQ